MKAVGNGEEDIGGIFTLHPSQGRWTLVRLEGDGYWGGREFRVGGEGRNMPSLFEKQWPQHSEQLCPFSQIIYTKSVWQCLAHIQSCGPKAMKTLPLASFRCAPRSASVDALQGNQGALLVFHVRSADLSDVGICHDSVRVLGLQQCHFTWHRWSHW